ncbi:hypothetical protein HanRHA438_Chr02g0060451 [Helianthus annuus]|nr:hypothetical protein HanRHA438_Chr02g0060451 [Helianthus annuus]
MNTRLFKRCSKISSFIQDKLFKTSWSTMYQSQHQFCVGFGISDVYYLLLFWYQFPLQFQIGSCINFCISRVPAFIFTDRVNDRFSSVSVLLCCVLFPLI